MSYRTHLTVNSALRALLKRGTQIGLSVSAFAPMLALASPTGGQVVAGTATIKNPNANTTVVKQSTASAIIDWQQFNIGKGQYVQFLQPSSSSVILNRVIGGGGSSIFGTLTGNGQVFLVNTNGVFFGKGSSIDAQGFLASTLDISDSNFMSGHYLFDKGTNADAQVVNQGSITAHKGGYVVLAGDYAENDGLISAQSGHIILASGSKSTLTLNGNSLVSYAINQATLANLAGANNAGKLSADGGTVLMTADVANLLKATVVNNTGLIEAHAISKAGGSIQLLASGGNIVNAGTIDASAIRAGQQGGTITLKGDERTTLTDTSKIVATGDGANGGNVEVSGNTLSMRGAMSLGKGGKLLLDPNSILLVAGSNGSSTVGSKNNFSSGTGNLAGAGKVGVAFIEKELNAGTFVDVAAHSFINASSNVHDIIATGIGNLKFEAGQGIELSGVDIAIGGNLTVDMGYGDFGHLQAASIDLNASHSFLRLASAVTNSKGVVTQYSLKATTGGITLGGAATVASDQSSSQHIVALSAKGRIDVKGKVSLAGKLQAKASGGYASFSDDIRANQGVSIQGQGVFVDGSIAAYGGKTIDLEGDDFVTVAGAVRGGDVTLDASQGGVNLGSVSADGLLKIGASAEGLIFIDHAGSTVTLHGTKGVQITGAAVIHSGGLNIAAPSGAIDVEAGLGNSTEGLNGDLTLQAQKGVKLGHSVFVVGRLDVEGSALAYTGKAASFTLSAEGGDLVLGAAIGTAKAPVAYDVNIFDSDAALHLKRSIYTKRGISVNEAGRAGSGTSATTGAGIYVGNSDGTAIALSAKGAITLTGARVAVGYVDHISSGFHPGVGPITISADDGNAKTSTDTLTLHASDTALGFGVFLGAGTGSFGSNAGHKLTVNRAVTLHAGADILVSGRDVDLSGGGFRVFTSGAGGSVNLNDRLSLSAGRDVSMVASHGLVIAGGADRGSIGADAGTKETISITGGVSVTAGRDVLMSGSTLGVHGGRVYGNGSVASSVTKPNKATVAITSGVSLKAGRDLDLTATVHDLTVTGGTSVGTGSGAFAEAAGAVVNVSLHGDISLTAGDAANLKAKHAVTLHAGSHVGAGFQSHFSVGTGASGTGTSLDQERIFADGKGATATVTDTANLSISTGKGGFSASAQSGGVVIRGGSDAGAGAIISATATGAKASLTAQATVSIADKGVFTLKGTGVAVHGGDGAARLQSSSRAGTSSTAFSHIKPARLTGIGGANMAYNVASGVTITAAGAVNVTTPGGELSLRAGSQESQSLQVHIDSTGTKGATQVNIDSSLSLTGASTVTLKAGDMLLRASGGALDEAALTAQAGTLNVTDKVAVHITAGKGLIASASSGVVQIFGGSAANKALLHADDGAKVKASVDASVTLSNAKGDMTLQGKGLFVEGSAAGHVARVLGQNGGSAALSMDTGVNLKTAGHLDLNGGISTLAILAGRAATQGSSSSAQVTAQRGKAKAGFIADTAVNVSAGSISLEGHQIHVFGGSSLARVAGVHASSAATANLQIDGAVLFKTAGVFFASANTSVDILGGTGIMGGSGHITAIGGGVTTVGIDGSVSITAGSMSLHGGHAVLVRGGSSAGHAISVGAIVHGKLTYAAKDGVSLIAAKHLTLAAVAGGVHVFGGLHAGSGVSVHAGAGAAASYSVDASVLVKGGDITVHGGSSGGVSIGNQAGVGKDMNLSGSSGGKAAFTVHGGVSLIAINSITVDHPAGSGSGKIEIGNFTSSGSVGNDGRVKGHGGTAKALVDASTLLQATGATGTITLEDSRGGTQLNTNTGVAQNDQASADFGGAASLGVKGSLALSAKGLVSIVGRSVLVTTGGATGGDQHVAGAGIGAKVTVTADASLRINAGKLDVHTSQNTTGNAVFQVGAGEGFLGSDRTSDGAAVTHDVDADIDVTVTGKLSITTPGGITLHGGNSADGSVGADAFFGGKLTRLVTAGVNVSAASASFSEGGGELFLSAGGFIANHQNVDVTAGASAKLTTQASVLVHTTHGFTDHGVSAGLFSQRAGSFDQFDASGAKSLITDVEQSMVSITAGGAVSLSVSGATNINAPSGDVEGVQSTPGAGGAINLSADTHVGISAGGAIGITATALSIAAGGHVGASSLVIAEGGKFTASVLDDVSLTAKTTLTLDVTGAGQMSLAARGQDVNSASYNVFQGGAIKVTQDDGVHMKAGGVLTITLGGGLFLASTAFHGSHLPTVGINGNGTLAVDVDAGISILGKSVHTTGESNSIVTGALGFSGSGVKYNSGFTVTGGPGVLAAPAPMDLGTLQQGALLMSVEPVLGMPSAGSQPTAYEPHPSVIGGARCEVSLLSDAGHCIVKR
jgi:filamentous hemagglutinin family protein